MPTAPRTQEVANLFQGRYNPEIFVIIKRFFEIVIKRFEQIYFYPSTLRVTREFPKEGQGLIVSARPFGREENEVTESPSPSERATARRRNRNRKVYDYVKVKKSAREFLIIKNHIMDFPQFFGKYFVAEQDKKDPSLFYYDHEELTPMFYEDGTKCGELEYFSVKEGMTLALKFSLETLNCLHILHNTFKLVHSDLSTGNILYSFVDRCWKVIDFDQTFTLKESLITKRTAGTPGYIAPECLKTGIFDQASDIWSLGRVIFDIFLLPLLPALEYYQLPALLKDSLLDLERVVIEMTATNVNARPTTTEALKRVFNIVKRFDGLYNDSHVVYARVCSIFTKVKTGKKHKKS